MLRSLLYSGRKFSGIFKEIFKEIFKKFDEIKIEYQRNGSHHPCKVGILKKNDQILNPAELNLITKETNITFSLLNLII